MRNALRVLGTAAFGGCTWLVPWPCAAEQASAAAGAAGNLAALGAWLFATVAFLACVVASYNWGRWRARSQRPEPSTLPQRALDAGAAPHQPPPKAWLEGLPQAALLAAPLPQGFCVEHLNTAAQSLWPHAGAGTPLEALPGLSAASRQVLQLLRPGQAGSFDGWRFASLSEGPGGTGRAAVLITQVADSAHEADVFGSTLSHDLRAPIRVVEGFTRIVKEDYGRLLDRVGNEHLDRVLGATARMNLMIDALLTMARLSAQPLARQPVDMSQLALVVMDDLERGSAGARRVSVEIEPGLQASGDPTLLRLVLENLLGNAWKYTARTEGARIALRATTHQGAPAFCVSDNGAGFDMRVADRLFGLFQRLHSASDFPGHGVGLASVRRIVRRHGGEIWAEGRPGQGATFTFTLG